MFIWNSNQRTSVAMKMISDQKTCLDRNELLISGILHDIKDIKHFMNYNTINWRKTSLIGTSYFILRSIRKVISLSWRLFTNFSLSISWNNLLRNKIWRWSWDWMLGVNVSFLVSFIFFMKFLQQLKCNVLLNMSITV